jgi:uncharacterized protein with PIN domain
MKFLLGPELSQLFRRLKILNYGAYCFKGSKNAFLSRAVREDRVVLSSKSSLSYSNSNAVIFNIKSKDVKTQLKELKEKSVKRGLFALY